MGKIIKMKMKGDHLEILSVGVQHVLFWALKFCVPGKMNNVNYLVNTIN